jgi:hypothetical protein
MGLSWQQGPLAPGSGLAQAQAVIPHGTDRDLTLDEVAPGR